MHLNLLLMTPILLSVLTSARQEDDMRDASAKIDQHWKDFSVKFEKSYATAAEESFRKKIFAKSLKEVEAHNALYSEGLTSYTIGINQFSDMEDEEFTKTMTCAGVTDLAADSKIAKCDTNSENISEPIDWRNKGHVRPVQNQSTCGACWAFAATGALEALMTQTTGKSVSLSAQDLVDCSSTSEYGNKGCNGGSPEKAFSYVVEKGIESEASYPYTATNSTCRHRASKTACKIGDFNVTSGETCIQNFVGKTGPIAVHMFASISFKCYHGGVYNNATDCNGTVNHSALIVGYGTDNSTGEDYWIIKNSWGTTWGINGYAHVIRNKEMCGIGRFAAYPLKFISVSKSSYQSASVMYILLLWLFINLFITK